MNLEQKKMHLDSIIQQLGSVAVAFSGGVDSTYLLASCCDVLGTSQVLAVTATSPSLPTGELDEAQTLVNLLGVQWEVIDTHELNNEAYACNNAQRCFYCKDELFRSMQPVVKTHGMSTMVYGANADDMSDHRPGMWAAQQHHVRAPLLEARLGKVDIRVLAKRRNLPNHDKPAMACLSSRVPYGTPITPNVLRQIDQAEAFLKYEIGLKQVRVRHHGNVARLEIPVYEMSLVMQPDIREHIVARLRDIGFTYIALDLAGFQSGSMNAMLIEQSDLIR